VNLLKPANTTAAKNQIRLLATLPSADPIASSRNALDGCTPYSTFAGLVITAVKNPPNFCSYQVKKKSDIHPISM